MPVCTSQAIRGPCHCSLGKSIDCVRRSRTCAASYVCRNRRVSGPHLERGGCRNCRGFGLGIWSLGRGSNPRPAAFLAFWVTRRLLTGAHIEGIYQAEPPRHTPTMKDVRLKFSLAFVGGWESVVLYSRLVGFTSSCAVSPPAPAR